MAREEIDDRVLYRWFVGLGMDAPIGSPTTVSKKRERLLASDVASAFFDAVVTQARAAGLLSDEHVTVATSAQRRRGRRRTIRAIRRSISTARAARRPRLGPRPIRTRRSFAKGAAGAVRSSLGHVVLDHRQGLVVNPCVTAATGPAASAGYAARG